MAGSPDDYSALLVTKLAGLHRETITTAKFLEADGRPAQASKVRQAYFAFLDELKAIARATSAEAGAAIRTAQLDSRVRPDTGGLGGPRLGEYIGTSDPLDAVPGSVGINDEEYLRQSPVSWWWTNEEGYSGFVGEERKGFFHSPGGGFVAPNQSESGVHPLFSPMRRGRKMLIQEPIPARYFVRDGVHEVTPGWQAAVNSAADQLVSKVRAAMVAARATPAPRRRRP